MRARDRVALVLFAVAALAGAYAALIAWTGGFDLGVMGLRIRSRTWLRAAVIALIAAAGFIAAARARLAAALREGWGFVDDRRVALALTIAAAAWATVAALLFSTLAVGGSDSYGYVSQARLLAAGRLTDRVPLEREYRWPRAHESLAPLGYRPAGRDGTIAPTYPPGLPLLMAPLTWLPDPAVYLVVPLFGVLAVLMCYGVGTQLGDPLAGGLGAILLAASPTFLFQVVQPMSDVPAAACWLLALLLAARGSRSTAALAGAAASVAVLIRPNLAPLAVLVAALAMAHDRRWADRLRTASAFVALLLPGVLALAAIQQIRYGSPLSSGYDSFGNMFSLDHIVPNLQRYPRWLTELHTWFIWAWLPAPFWIAWRPSGARRFAWTAYAFAAAVFAAYLPYLHFQPHEWTYARFLLPALPLMLVLGAALALAAIRRLPAAARATVAVALFGALALVFLRAAEQHKAFSLRAGESRYPAAAHFVRDRLPREAFVIAAQHSGSIRYYAGRPILRWDVVPAHWLDAAVAALRARGHMVFAVLDDDEYPAFYGRFDAAGQQTIRRLRLVGLPADVRIYVFIFD